MPSQQGISPRSHFKPQMPVASTLFPPYFCRQCLLMSSGAPPPRTDPSPLHSFYTNVPLGTKHRLTPVSTILRYKEAPEPTRASRPGFLLSIPLSIGLSPRPLGSVSRTPQIHPSPWPGLDEHSHLHRLISLFAIFFLLKIYLMFVFNSRNPSVTISKHHPHYSEE